MPRQGQGQGPPTVWTGLQRRGPGRASCCLDLDICTDGRRFSCCCEGMTVSQKTQKTTRYLGPELAPIMEVYTRLCRYTIHYVSSVSSVAQSCLTLCNPPWAAACQASLSITNSQGPLKLKSIKLVMPSNHLILCHPLLLLPSIFPSIRFFSSESALCIRWLKYWSFTFSINPSNEYSGLIFLRMDWFDLLVVQGSLKTLLQHHSSKA